MRSTFLAVAMLCLLLAGCGEKAVAPEPVHPTQPAPVYRLLVRIVQETPDGAPIRDAEVYAVPESEASPDPAKLPAPRFADDRGEVAFQFPQPVTLLVQAFGPGKGGGGWTREGMRLEVGDTVSSDRGLRVDGHAVTLPLLRAERAFLLNATWGNAAATVAPNGSIVPAQARFPLDLGEPYQGRLASIRMDLAWQQTPEAFGDLYAGLARGDGAPVRGTDVPQAPTPGSAHESVGGLPPGTGPLRAVAITDKAVVGMLGLRFTGTMRFEGWYPAVLPAPTCLAAACGPLPALPPPPSWPAAPG
ncbi:MAG TPA: hypothetical protein VM286_00395 [Candidatus Thermoplasmatota archaeon]|nr:hypothetical protein [Candidatus Thermoplasmatota archaeon]